MVPGFGNIYCLRSPGVFNAMMKMAWNPNTYNKFKAERFLPFFDLTALITLKEELHVIDLGCGTGELTKKLADLLPHSKVLGVDSSEEMLADSRQFQNEDIHFEKRSIEDQLERDMQWDLVFSNAAIQWVANHRSLLPRIVSSVKTGGQLAIQLPAQQHNVTNVMLAELAESADFQPIFKNLNRTDNVLDIDDYAQLLFDCGGTDITVFEKIYPLVLENTDALYDWVSGTALLPYLAKLEDEDKQRFTEAFKQRLISSFPKLPVFIPFRRILMKATF